MPSPDEIVDAARAHRPRTPRWVWVCSLAIGALCLGAFAYAMFADHGTPSHPPLVATDTGLGFGTGIAVGLVMGIGIGLAIARARSAADRTSLGARQRRAHSSRSKP